MSSLPSVHATLKRWSAQEEAAARQALVAMRAELGQQRMANEQRWAGLQAAQDCLVNLKVQPPRLWLCRHGSAEIRIRLEQPVGRAEQGVRSYGIIWPCPALASPALHAVFGRGHHRQHLHTARWLRS